MPIDFWGQRETFRAWVAEARYKLKINSNGAVAKHLGLAASSLYKYLSPNMTHKPSTEVLKKLGDMIGRDYRLLLDAPGSMPEWQDSSAWQGATQRDRFMAAAMFADITAEDLSDEEKDELFSAWKEAVARWRRHKAMKSREA